MSELLRSKFLLPETHITVGRRNFYPTMKSVAAVATVAVVGAQVLLRGIAEAGEEATEQGAVGFRWIRSEPPAGR